MRPFALIIGALFLLTACATTPPKENKYEATCRTHARTVTFSGSPDENIPFLECMKMKGAHEVEVTETME